MAFLPKYQDFRGVVGKTLGHLGSKDSLIAKIAIVLVTITVIALMFPLGEAIEHEYSVGGIWVEKDLIAPFSFPIYKDEQQYEREKREAAANVAPVFERRVRLVDAQRESLITAIERFQRSREMRSVWRLRDHLVRIFDDIMLAGIVDRPEIRHTHKSLAIRRGTEETIKPSGNVYDMVTALEMCNKRLENLFEGIATAPEDRQKKVEVVLDIFRGVLKPTLIYSELETEKLRQVAMDNVPRTIGFVQENERIIGKHERITEDVKLKLDSLRRARAERGAEHTHTWQYAGTVLHVALVTFLYGIYLFLFRKKIFHDNRKIALIAILLVIECFFAFLTLEIEVRAPVQYLIVIPAASMLLTIMFDSRVAFYGTVTMAFLVAGIRGNDYTVALASLVAGALAVYTVRDIKHRTQIFRSLAFVFTGYACVILAVGLERFAEFKTIVSELTFAFANAVFSPVLTYGLLIFFERAFRVTTDLTLLELADFNSPLLRQLSERAPGTFHHSVTLGNLAEAAAEAIGANAILARVGAYYHDIGKLLKPQYFMENQKGKSRHNRLRPRMSALIIASHVKEGIELGRKHGLPEVILDFIPQHHGTTLIGYFYDKALKEADERRDPKEEVHEGDYRYPGPKPQTKETGIVMLADAVEATARALDDPTPQKLEAMIDASIKNRFVEGQLDECELTLRDLSKIKSAFLKILVGIHHSRMKYPESEKEEQTLREVFTPVLSEQHQRTEPQDANDTAQN